MTGKTATHLELMQARVEFIPEGWKFEYLSGVFNICNTFRKPISADERAKIQGQYPYYGPTKIQDYISEFEQDGDFALIGEDGDHFLKYRTQPMTQLIEGKCTVNNHAHIIEGTSSACREWFFYYFMHRDIFSFLTRQGAGRYKLNKSALEKLPLLVPKLIEQKKIAQILSTWDKAITTTEQLLANSQQQKKALMQQLLTGKRRLPGFTGDWQLKPLTEFFRESRDKGTTGESARKLTVKLYGRGVVAKDEKRVGSASTQYYTRSAGQFIYSKLDFLNGAFGVISAELDGYESTLDLPAFDFLPGVCHDWLLATISRPDFYVSNIGLANGGRKARRVNPKDFLRIKVATPTMDEQQAIARVLSTADKEILALLAQLEAVRSEKKSLLQQLLTGKRRVQIDKECSND